MSTGGKGKHRSGKTLEGEKSTETINGYAVSYVQKYVKCGKQRCKKCKEPGGGHGPYWYKMHRTPEGKVRTTYAGKVADDDIER